MCSPIDLRIRDSGSPWPAATGAGSRLPGAGGRGGGAGAACGCAGAGAAAAAGFGARGGVGSGRYGDSMCIGGSGRSSTALAPPSSR